MLKIGLTGGIGSGKTTVSNIFHKLGIPVIDTDVIAHELTDTKPVLDEITSAFGNTLLGSDGKLNRSALAKRVFENPEERAKLENILHPKIRHTINKEINLLDNTTHAVPYIIIVIPLLMETDFSKIVDRILVVMANETDRINRIIQRDNRNLDEIRSIISTQVSDQHRVDIADDIIKNDCDIKELETQIQNLHEKYTTLSVTK